MNAGEAMDRLSTRYGLEAELYDGHVEAAESALEALAPFEADVDLNDPPEPLLDYVAFKALETKQAQGGDAPASRVTAGDVTVELAGVAGYDPSALVAPYLKRTGSRV